MMTLITLRRILKLNREQLNKEEEEERKNYN